jgi:hypothetical protein
VPVKLGNISQNNHLNYAVDGVSVRRCFLDALSQSPVSSHLFTLDGVSSASLHEFYAVDGVSFSSAFRRCSQSFAGLSSALQTRRRFVGVPSQILCSRRRNSTVSDRTLSTESTTKYHLVSSSVRRRLPFFQFSVHTHCQFFNTMLGVASPVPSPYGGRHKEAA